MPGTICAIATPPGVGGVAVVRVSGPEAFAIAARVFVPLHRKKSVLDARGYTALFGHYRLDGRPMDETVALFFRAPHSYTGEDVVELSVHGGTAMADGLIEALLTAGAVPAAPGEFTRRALENGRIGLVEAEAVMAAISAEGRQGAALAGAALDGRLGGRIAAIRDALQAVAAHLAAWVDYPEEDVPALAPDALKQTLGQQKKKLDALIEESRAGAVLRHGVDCVLTGRPNVGKSTLLNLLAGFDRAIVTPVAGTTRDVLEQAVVLQPAGIRLNVFDTAGLRAETDDAIEAEGVRRGREKFAQAGLVLAVFDAGAPLEAEDLALAQSCAGRAALAVLNKRDLVGSAAELAEKTNALTPYFAKVLPLCALEDTALPALSAAVAALLGTARLDPGAAVLCSRRQLAAALAARDALGEALAAAEGGFGLDAVAVCLADAQRALADLTGEDAPAATIDAVFRDFCVGK